MKLRKSTFRATALVAVVSAVTWLAQVGTAGVALADVPGFSDPATDACDRRICLWRHENFVTPSLQIDKMGSVGLDVDVPNLNRVKKIPGGYMGLNDGASSVVTLTAWDVCLYEHTDYHGSMLRIKGNSRIPELRSFYFNDRISSVDIGCDGMHRAARHIRAPVRQDLTGQSKQTVSSPAEFRGRASCDRYRPCGRTVSRSGYFTYVKRCAATVSTP